MSNNQKQKPRLQRGAFVVSFKNHRKNTTPSQHLNQLAFAGLRFHEMQKAAALFQEYPSDENAAYAEKMGSAYSAAFSLACVEV